MKYTSTQEIYANTESRNGLPAWAYSNAELTELEMQQLFLRSWLFVGHVSDIPNCGDYQCLGMANERAVVVRGEDGQVRAFHNLCRHRASRVVAKDKGHCGKSFICPFHGWSYNLDGTLKNIPRANAFPEFNKDELGLKSIDCEIWHGLIFVRFGGDGPSVAEQFVEAEAEIGLYKIEDMKPLDDPYQYKFDLDWKAVLDIDNEGYHVPIGHPELFDLVGSTYTDQLTEGGLSRSSGSFKGRKHKSEQIQSYVDALPEDSYLPEPYRQQWIYWGMFPGFVLTLFPDQIEIYQIYSTGSQKSVMAGVTYALPDDRETMRKARELNREINMEVGDEDIRLIEWAAQGMRSSAFEGILLSDLESGVASFQKRLREVLPVVSLQSEPESGTLAQVNERMQAQARVSAVG